VGHRPRMAGASRCSTAPQREKPHMRPGSVVFSATIWITLGVALGVAAEKEPDRPVDEPAAQAPAPPAPLGATAVPGSHGSAPACANGHHWPRPTLWDWLNYRPCCSSLVSCGHRCVPCCTPPLYAFFPCVPCNGHRAPCAVKAGCAVAAVPAPEKPAQPGAVEAAEATPVRPVAAVTKTCARCGKPCKDSTHKSR